MKETKIIYNCNKWKSREILHKIGNKDLTLVLGL